MIILFNLLFIFNIATGAFAVANCPTVVISTEFDKISFATSPYGPTTTSEVNKLLQFPAKVRTCTADGYLLLLSKIGPVWVSGIFFNHNGLELDIGKIRGNSEVMGATRGHSE